MIVLRALRQFFQAPPRALRIVLAAALAVEAAGFVFGIAPVGPVVRDALHAHGASLVAGTLLFAACVCALHASIAAVVAGAALVTRRAPWLAGLLAAGPLALAWFGFRAPFGFSVATSSIQLQNETPLALLEAAAVHLALAALACIIVLVAVLFALIRRGGAEGGRTASNGGAS